MYKNKGGRPRKSEEEKAKPNDYIQCKICGEKFRRNNRWAHNQTKLHQKLANLHDDIRTVALTNKNEIPASGPITIPQFHKKCAVDKFQKRLTEYQKNKYYEDSDNDEQWDDSSESEEESSTETESESSIDITEQLKEEYKRGYYKAKSDNLIQLKQEYNRGIKQYHDSVFDVLDMLYKQEGDISIPISIINDMINPKLTHQQRIDYANELNIN
jgi:hypothetical protein